MTKSIPKRPRRIGIDARFFRRETGGIGRYTRELLHYMLPLDTYNEYVIFLTPPDMAQWDIVQANVKTVVVNAVHYTSREQTVFLSALLKEKLDLVHFLNFNHPLLYPKPFVTTLQDLTLFMFPARAGKANAVKHAVFRQVFKHSLTGAKKVIAISENSAADAEKMLGISHAKMEIVYEGGPEPMQFLPGTKDLVQKYLGTRDPYFLFVSQWRPHKGILTLIKAFEQFKAETHSAHKLVLVGKREAAEESVKKAMAESPVGSDIIATGFAPDDILPALFHHATAAVVPSEYEGFGLPVLEAYSYGTPAIAANNSSLPEIVGDGGLLFPTRDATALAESMMRIVSDSELRAHLLAKGKKQLQKFSWEKCAQETLAVYKSILEK